MANEDNKKPLNISVAYITKELKKDNRIYRGVMYYGEDNRPKYMRAVEFKTDGYGQFVKHCFDEAFRFVGGEDKYYLGTSDFHNIETFNPGT